MRHLIRARRCGGLIALCVAYALVIQALMASVGLGMSAAAAPGQADFVICGLAPAADTRAPAADGDQQKKPAPQPQCPFCFVAAQSAGHFAAMGGAVALPAYAGLRIIDALTGHRSDGTFVPRFHRMAGDPRAPPRFPSSDA